MAPTGKGSRENSDIGDNDTASLQTSFRRQSAPGIANAAHLTRLWDGGWSAALFRRSHDLDNITTEDTIDYLEGEGPFFGELYQIETTVGEGSFGLCYSAVHMGRECCVKIEDKMQAGDEYRTCLVEEGMFNVLLRKQKHPNVVHYFDFLECPLHYYVVMEHLQGPELFDKFIEDFPVTEKYVQNVMRQVLSALQQLRLEGIVHRDVKLENFRYATQGDDAELKLLDFGFARKVDAAWESKISGTLLYLAPEIVSDVPETDRAGFAAAADVWAAGVVLCILLTGKEPFKGSDVWNLGRAHGQNMIDGLLASNKLTQSSPEAIDLLRKLLTIDPQSRITAEEALHHPWFSTSTSSCLDVSRESYMKAKQSSRRSQMFINAPVDKARTLSRNMLSVGSNKRVCATIAGQAVRTVPEMMPNASALSWASDDELFCYD